MATGTFQKQGDGLSQKTSFRPDFETGPSGPLGYKPSKWELTGQTPTTMTVRYESQ